MFWSLTLSLFVRLLERHHQAQREIDLRFGQVAATIYNVNRGKAKALDWQAFFPDPRPQPRDDEKVRMQHAALRAGLMAMQKQGQGAAGLSEDGEQHPDNDEQRD